MKNNQRLAFEVATAAVAQKLAAIAPHGVANLNVDDLTGDVLLVMAEKDYLSKPEAEVRRLAWTIAERLILKRMDRNKTIRTRSSTLKNEDAERFDDWQGSPSPDESLDVGSCEREMVAYVDSRRKVTPHRKM